MLATNRIDAARGLIPCDMNFSNCRVFDVFRGSISAPCTVSVHSGYIVGVGTGLTARETVDMEGRTIAPGFIDAHVHIESTLLSPREYARLAVPRGVTAAVADPHEIANVLGYDGIVWMLKASENLPMDIRFMMPSCVPATTLDTSGASLYASDMQNFLNEPRVLGLGEMMNYPGVLAKDPQVLDKIALFAHPGKTIDGHAPGLSGKDLAAYVTAGIASDHEATTPEEAYEKISAGMWIMLREGSGARDLEKLLPAVNSRTARRMMLCADDRHSDDIAQDGYIDRSVRMLIEGGVDPIDAYLMGSRNTCEYFNIRDSGAIAPGFKADFMALDDFKGVRISRVYKDGILAASNGVMETGVLDSNENPGTPTLRAVRDSVNIKTVSENDFKIPSQPGKIRVIGAKPGSLVTDCFLAEPKTEGGFCVSDTERDILTVFVIERHIGTGNIGRGFIKGFGLKKGAFATTVSHDSHNMIVVGADDISIFKAVKHLNRIKGGMVVTDGETVLADLPLPIAGLMSDQNAETVLAALKNFEQTFKTLGVTMQSPFMTLSFMTLPVIPSLKITDMGLVDVDAFKKIDLFAPA